MGTKKISNEELLEEIKIATLALGRPPRFQEMQEVGQYSPQVYLDRFGSWPESIEAAGVEYDYPNEGTSREEIIEDVKRVRDEHDIDRPSTLDYEKHGTYSLNAVRRHFNYWHELLREVDE